MIRLDHSPTFAPRFLIRGPHTATQPLFRVKTTAGAAGNVGEILLSNDLVIFKWDKNGDFSFPAANTDVVYGILNSGNNLTVNQAGFTLKSGATTLGTMGFGTTRGGSAALDIEGVSGRPLQMGRDNNIELGTVITTADAVALTVKAHSTQTSNILEVQDSSSNILGEMSGIGRFTTRVNNANNMLTVETFRTTGSTQIVGHKARGTISSPTAVQSGDTIAQYIFAGYGATDYQTSATIQVFAEENYTDSTSKGRMTLSVTDAGAVTPAAIGIELNSNEVVINEQSAVMDFRVEGVGQTRLLLVRASTDRIGIADSTPDALLDIQGKADEIQLIVQAHSTQTSNLVEWQDSGGVASFLCVDQNGRFSLGQPTNNLARLLVEVDDSVDNVFSLYTNSITTATNNSTLGMVLQRTSTGDMSDGFGIEMGFRIEDTAGVKNTLGKIGAKRDGADNEGLLTFRAGTDGNDTVLELDSSLRAKFFGTVGVGAVAPSGINLHIEGASATARIYNISGDLDAPTRTMPGLDLVVGGVQINDYGMAVKWMSADAQLTTENPKLLAHIITQATQTINDDSDGGTDLVFGVTPDDPGTTNVPIEGFKISASYVRINDNRELRFYDDGANYVGFEAPALTANQIWVLPTADGNNLDTLVTDGAGTLAWATNASEKAWAFTSPSGSSGTFYYGGYYLFGATDNDFNPSITFGTANSSYAAHFFLVQAAGASGGTDTVIRITGTSITDAGVRTTSDTQDLTVDDAGVAGTYYETSKKWIGQITVVKLSGPDLLMNYGFCKYWDNNNTDFQISGVEATWLGGANDGGANIELIHHKATGWTYNAGSPPTNPAPVSDMNTDHNTEVNVVNNENGAWKRANLGTNVGGGDSEGTIFAVTTTANKAFELGNILLRIKPQP